MTASTLRLFRRLHLYLGVFFAPAIIFFALTGAVQTYGLHEPRAWNGKPPGWISAMANLHKHQQLSRPERPRPGPATQPAGGERKKTPESSEKFSIGAAALKLFTGLMGLALATASLLGIAVALGTRSTRRVSTVMLALGLVLPAALVLA